VSEACGKHTGETRAEAMLHTLCRPSPSSRRKLLYRYDSGTARCRDRQEIEKARTAGLVALELFRNKGEKAEPSYIEILQTRTRKSPVDTAMLEKRRVRVIEEHPVPD